MKGAAMEGKQITGFTPGPWSAMNWRVCANVDGPLRIKVICDTAHNKQTRTHENAANAQLIAAAPDLLAQVQTLTERCERLEGALKAFTAAMRVGEQPCLLKLIEALHKADAALTHPATGESK